MNPYFALVSIVFVVFIAIAVSFFEGQVKEDVLDSIDQESVETNQRLKEIVTTTLSNINQIYGFCIQPRQFQAYQEPILTME